MKEGGNTLKILGLMNKIKNIITQIIQDISKNNTKKLHLQNLALDNSTKSPLHLNISPITIQDRSRLIKGQRTLKIIRDKSNIKNHISFLLIVNIRRTSQNPTINNNLKVSKRNSLR